MRVAIIGASGYTGLELVRIVLRHPELELTVATSEQRAGMRFGDAFPALRGLTDLVIQQGIALGYGILTTEDREQAWRRAAVAELNKGADAAKACLTMVALKRRFRSSGPS